MKDQVKPAINYLKKIGQYEQLSKIEKKILKELLYYASKAGMIPMNRERLSKYLGVPRTVIDKAYEKFLRLKIIGLTD